MQRKRLEATALVSAVVGTLLLLALLAPSAVAGPSAETGSSPGNRGWVVDHSSDRGSGVDGLTSNY
jgi:hypothetical protein